jgi:hypothetical protein
MSLMDYQNMPPAGFDGCDQNRTMPMFHVAAVIGGGSLALWGLILFAVWTLI